MSNLLKLRALKSLEKEYIPLKHIESINTDSNIFLDDETRTVNKLKDDFVIRVTTLSGNNHLVSINQMKGSVEGSNREFPVDPKQFYHEVIFESWISIVQGE
jgi:acyl-ACP thioesterase